MKLQLQKNHRFHRQEDFICGNIGQKLRVGCGKLRRSKMYLVEPVSRKLHDKYGGQWICEDCCRQLGLIW